MIASSRGSKILSRDIDLLICDDIEDHGSTVQPAMREQTRNWFATDVGSRKVPTSAHVVIGSRQHPDDLYGHLIESEAWTTIVETAHSETCVLAELDVDAHVDCMLWPGFLGYRWLMEQLATFATIGGRSLWEMVYLNRPMAEGLMMFEREPILEARNFERGLYEWSISIGVMRNGVHVGGAIYAPEVNRGVLVAGERSTGTFVSRGTQADVVRCSVIDRPSRDRLVAFGPDIFFMPAFSRFVIETSKKVRTTNGTGSCPLGLALVATGQLDALVQPVQSPWDWFAGWPIVEAAGGKMIFYHYKDGVPVRIETIGPDAYSPTKRNVAFIAGGPECAEELFEDLQTYWAK